MPTTPAPHDRGYARSRHPGPAGAGTNPCQLPSPFNDPLARQSPRQGSAPPPPSQDNPGSASRTRLPGWRRRGGEDAGTAPWARDTALPGGTQPVPIASVAKVMTAYVILHDHPLAAGQSGPEIVVQPPEAAAYSAQARDGDSLVPVAAGEALTERQALEALLLPSADNMAWILARWDAGSQAAFVTRMNATARHLGMTGTR